MMKLSALKCARAENKNGQLACRSRANVGWLTSPDTAGISVFERRSNIVILKNDINAKTLLFACSIDKTQFLIRKYQTKFLYFSSAVARVGGGGQLRGPAVQHHRPGRPGRRRRRPREARPLVQEQLLAPRLHVSLRLSRRICNLSKPLNL